MFEYEQRDGIEVRGSLSLPGAKRTPIVTFALLGAILAVFVAMTSAGGSEDPDVLLRFGAMFGPFIANGEYWRLFSAMFLHFGVAHLATNGLGLFIFGRLVEKVFGHARFLTIYILAGLFGSVASYAFNSIAVGAGASGAIFGVLGALAAYFLVQREMSGRLAQSDLTGVLLLAGINLLYGFVTPGIDNWAHLAGFVSGFGLGIALAPRYRLTMSSSGLPSLSDTNTLAKRSWLVAATLGVLAAGAALATAAVPDTAYTHVYAAERYYRQRAYDEVLLEIDQVLNLDQTISVGQALYAVAEAHLLRGRIYGEVGNLDAARSDLAMATRWGGRETRAEALRLLLAIDSRR